MTFAHKSCKPQCIIEFNYWYASMQVRDIIPSSRTSPVLCNLRLGPNALVSVLLLLTSLLPWQVGVLVARYQEVAMLPADRQKGASEECNRVFNTGLDFEMDYLPVPTASLDPDPTTLYSNVPLLSGFCEGVKFAGERISVRETGKDSFAVLSAVFGWARILCFNSSHMKVFLCKQSIVWLDMYVQVRQLFNCSCLDVYIIDLPQHILSWGDVCWSITAMVKTFDSTSHTSR